MEIFVPPAHFCCKPTTALKSSPLKTMTTTISILNILQGSRSRNSTSALQKEDTVRFAINGKKMAIL